MNNEKVELILERFPGIELALANAKLFAKRESLNEVEQAIQFAIDDLKYILEIIHDSNIESK
jgi:hypothetical protein